MVEGGRGRPEKKGEIRLMRAPLASALDKIVRLSLHSVCFGAFSGCSGAPIAQNLQKLRVGDVSLAYFTDLHVYYLIDDMWSLDGKRETSRFFATAPSVAGFRCYGPLARLKALLRCSVYKLI